MKKYIVGAFILAALACGFTSNAAADETTVTGNAKCLKCVDKVGDTCQLVIQAKEDDKTVTYTLAQNDVSKAFHDNVAKEAKKVKATGTVKEEDGKKVMTATKLELVKSSEESESE